jgi:D-alanyl-D-alanine carboxypeptidase
MTASTRLQTLIDSLAPTRVPGLTLAVGNRDGLVWEGAAGYADIESQTPAHPACASGVGSITKVLVAVLVLQLVEEKRLGLDHTLNPYLSRTVLAGIANADTTTVGQLLSHYSGIASWEEDARWIRDARGERITPGKQWASVEPLDYIRGASPAHDVGTRFHYSNTHYTLLGLLIEAVTAKPFEQVLAERILGPLNMAYAHLERADTQRPSRLCTRYHGATDTFIEAAGIAPSFRQIQPEWLEVSSSNLSVEWAAGGVVSSASDIVRFMTALRDGRLLGSELLQQMLTWRPAHKGTQMGLGIFRAATPHGAVIGHGGNVLGFSATTWWFEEADCVLALLTNLGSMHAGPQAWSASRLFESSLLGREAQALCSGHRR